MTRLLRFLRENAADVLSTAALVMIGVGFALERPSLGLIVPGCIVLGVMVVEKVIDALKSP